MPNQEEGPARGPTRDGAIESSRTHDSTTSRSSEVARLQLSLSTHAALYSRYRDPLSPRVGVPLHGDASDGLLLRWAPLIPVRQPLRLSVELIASGSVASAVSYRLAEFAEAEALPADVSPLGQGTSMPNSAALLRQALGLLLAASDRTIGVSGIGLPFTMAKLTSPCPVCKSTGAVAGLERGCVISTAGLVVCRGKPSDEILHARMRPLAAVLGCKCPGSLWALSEPANSRLVTPTSEVLP